ncbi:MAG: DNA-binding protein [Alphaproteobacteria bacterium]|nr:DNA-binding protein [Alphaproteobacteria bacterium]
MEIRRNRPFEANSLRTPAKRPVVGVMGGSAVADPVLPEAVGAWLGDTGWDLLTGAGAGTMEIVSRAFSARPGRGLVIGVVPGELGDGDEAYETASEAYPNPWVEVAIYTHLPRARDPEGLSSRNPINVLTSDVVVVLPGEAGTLGELGLAVRLCKPVAVWLGPSGRLGGLDANAVRRTFGPAAAVAGSFDDIAAFVERTMVRLGYGRRAAGR